MYIERTEVRVPRTIEELSSAQVGAYKDFQVDVATTLKLLRKTKVLFEHYYHIKDVNQAYFLEEIERIFDGKTNSKVFDLLKTRVPEWENKTGFAVLAEIVSEVRLVATDDDRERNKVKAMYKTKDGGPIARGGKEKTELSGVSGNGGGSKDKKNGAWLPCNIPAIIEVVNGRFEDFLSGLARDTKGYEAAREEILGLIAQIPPEYLESNIGRLSRNMNAFLKRFLKSGRMSLEEELSNRQLLSDFCTYLRGFQYLPYRRNDTF